MRVNVAEAKARFSELVRRASMGEEVVIARDNHPVVRLVPVRPTAATRKPGTAKGLVLYMAEDFDATPPGFAEYMP